MGKANTRMPSRLRIGFAVLKWQGRRAPAPSRVTPSTSPQTSARVSFSAHRWSSAGTSRLHRVANGKSPPNRDVTATAVRYHARIVASLRRVGTPIPMNEVWTGASPMECNGHLPTFDRDYRRIMGLGHMSLEAQ